MKHYIKQLVSDALSDNDILGANKQEVLYLWLASLVFLVTLTIVF